MSQRKALEEEISEISEGRTPWLEPFRKWVREAKNSDQIVHKGPLNEKKALAVKVFGSNLVLDGKKARGKAVKPWAILVENELPQDVECLFEATRKFFQEDRRS